MAGVLNVVVGTPLYAPKSKSWSMSRSKKSIKFFGRLFKINRCGSARAAYFSRRRRNCGIAWTPGERVGRLGGPDRERVSADHR